MQKVTLEISDGLFRWLWAKYHDTAIPGYGGDVSDMVAVETQIMRMIAEVQDAEIFERVHADKGDDEIPF